MLEAAHFTSTDVAIAVVLKSGVAVNVGSTNNMEEIVKDFAMRIATAEILLLDDGILIRSSEIAMICPIAYLAEKVKSRA